jgi:protocatechuate 3,4-dioxygenase, alpha subunit
VPDGEGGLQAPHIDVSVFARGILDRVVTRIYFADEAEANAEDVVLRSLPDDDARRTMIATPSDDGYRLDIHLQGDRETVFFAV